MCGFFRIDYACHVTKIQVRLPRSGSDVIGSLQAVVLIAFVTLKLTGVVTWSWWWVTSSAWISFVGLLLLASGLFISYSLAAPLWGWAVTRYGPRHAIMASLAVWALTCFWSALAQGYGMLLA